MDIVKNIILEVENLKTNKEYEKAMNLLNNSIKSKNDDYRIYEEIADIHIYQWNFAKAKKAINYAIKLNPESSTWNYLKWFMLLSLSKIEDAIFYLEKSNSLTPNNAEVLRNLWWAYTMLWDVYRWIAILKRRLIMSPSDTLITEDLAMSYLQIWEVNIANELLTKIWKSNFKYN